MTADVVGRNIESGEEENDVVADVAVDVAESIVEEEELVADIVSDETLFKIPNIKRKRARKSSEMAKTSRPTTAGSVKLDDSEGSMIDDSDSEVVDSKTGRSRRSDYNFDKIKSFLQKTKNAKNVQFEEFFADRRMFINSVIVLMKGEGGEQFTVQEIYRLKKLVSKLKLELQNEDFFFLMVLSVLFPFILFILMSVLRVGSLNLNGGRDLHKRALLFELIKQ